jgi:hypothetical protein
MPAQMTAVAIHSVRVNRSPSSQTARAMVTSTTV